ncbi:MAG: GntP family permease [Bacteroidota bacterium]
MSTFLFILLVLTAAVGSIILLTSVVKIHPIISLLAATALTGFALGLSPEIIIEKITSGFGELLGSIGLLVVFGSILGVLIEKSGALQRIAEFVLQLFGKRRPVTAMSILGFIVGVPVFCDSGYIVLSKLSKLVAKNSRVSSATTSLGLAAGLYTTHTLVPPTPGPIAAAGNLGVSDQLGTVMFIGLIVSIPVILISILSARRLGSNMNIEAIDLEIENTPGMSGILRAALPILLPILLISASSVLRFLDLQNYVAQLIQFLGNPLTALFIGVLIAQSQLMTYSRKQHTEWLAEGISQAGPILVLTGVGGAFGAVLKATSLKDELLAVLQQYDIGFIHLILCSFILAAILKTSQGSSTSAIVITSSILIPFVQIIGISDTIQISLIVAAIGAGAMTVSHANDSYFWVVSQFGNLSVQDTYKSYTLITLLQGITGIITVLILALLLT